MRRQTTLLTAGFLAFGFLPAPAHATVLSTFLNDPTGFNAASASLVTIDFSTVVGANTYTSYSTAGGVTVSGATFVGYLGGGGFYLWANSIVGGAGDWGSGAKLLGPEYRPGSFLQITLPAGSSAFGIELMTLDPQAQSFVFNVNGVPLSPAVITQLNPIRTFFGFTSDVDITQIQISLNSGTLYSTYPLYDNVSFGTLASTGGGGGGGGGDEEVPSEAVEVTTLLYMGTGLAMVAVAKKFKRDQPAH